MAVFFYVLVVIEAGGAGLLKPGQEIVGSTPYYSEASCEEAARLVAQGLFVKEGTKYGFKCVPVDYEPPRIKP